MPSVGNRRERGMLDLAVTRRIIELVLGISIFEKAIANVRAYMLVAGGNSM